jgi:excisionase family DNA binding protein
MSEQVNTLPEPERLWQVADVAAYLGVSRSQVYAWAARGELPALRLGRLLRFSPGQVRAWALAKGQAKS